MKIVFKELEKYKKNGHFVFKRGTILKSTSKNVPNEPGVYYVLKVINGNSELVYIGKSGSMLQNGNFKDQLLLKRLNNKQDGVRRQDYFEDKFMSEDIEALNFYWYVTVDDENKDLPAYVEGLLMQKFYEVNGCLPAWNKCF